MNIAVASLMTAEAFVHWSENNAGRHERIDGMVVTMDAARAIYATVKLHVAIALKEAVGRAQIAAEVFGDGMAVRISGTTVHDPDALVRLGVRLDPSAVVVSDPVIVIEVLSPSTGPIDTKIKLVNYFMFPSVAHYLVVNAQEQIVQHYRRSDAGDPVMTLVRQGTLQLDPPGLSIDVATFFT